MKKYRVSGEGPLPIVLGETDTVNSVLQNVGLILRTRRGSCPMYRGFGLPMEFLDRPATVVQALLLNEVKTAVEEYEPRAEVTDVLVAESQEDLGKIVPIVEVLIHVQQPAL